VSGQQIVCLVAAQRAGTTALQVALAATGRLENFSEIFQTDATDRPGSFFSFCRTHGILLSDVATAPKLAHLMQSYIAHLRELAADRHVLIDVKFNSWGAVRPAWRYPLEEPYFLGFLKSLNAVFVFIRRLDVAAQIASAHIARAAGRWHDLPAESIPAGPVELDLKQVAREADNICATEAFLWGHLRRYPRLVNVTYESLYENGGLSAAAGERIASAIGEPLTFPRIVPVRRNELDKKAVVRNYADVTAAVARVTAGYQRPPEL
jgi:LPS sulfotransferase NodH